MSAVRRIGIDHVAPSTDFNHDGGIGGWASVADTGAVDAAPEAKGYADTDLASLWGGNVLHVWQAAKAPA